jgi:hypothetical protein
MFEKGKSGNPNGRPKGIPNKDTQEVKDAYLALIQGNLPMIQEWLDRVAERDPGRAFDMLMKLSPFVIPKKQEMDLNIENPINIVIPKPKEEND